MSEETDVFPEKEGGPPLNDWLSEGDPPVKNSVFEKIRGVSRGIFEKYGVQYRSGRGRPRNDGDPKASDVPLNAPASALPAAGAPGSANGHPSGSSGIVKRCYKSLAKAFSGWADKIIFRKVVELSGDKAYAREVVTEIALTEPEADAFGELIDELASMWGADEKFMALAASLCTVTAVGGRYWVVNRDLDKQLAVRRAQTSAPIGGPKP